MRTPSLATATIIGLVVFCVLWTTLGKRSWIGRKHQSSEDQTAVRFLDPRSDHPVKSRFPSKTDHVTDKATIDELLQRATTLYREENLEAALDVVEVALERTPDREDALRLQLRIWHKQIEAEWPLEKAKTINPLQGIPTIHIDPPRNDQVEQVTGGS